MKDIYRLYLKCRNTDTSFIYAILNYAWYRLKGKEILLHQRTIIKGSKNIHTAGLLQVGTSEIGFTHQKDYTYLNIQGLLIFEGPYTIGRGCRFDIGEKAVVKIGKGGFINPFTKLIIYHGLEIGDNCLISWDCQFLDDDFHDINYEGRQNNLDKKIVLTNSVWVGCNVSIYKGTRIAQGSIIAANSVVRGVFDEDNVLIAGNPAKIIKRNVSWH